MTSPDAEATVAMLREVVKSADWDHEPKPWQDMARHALDSSSMAQAYRERIEAQAIAAYLASLLLADGIVDALRSNSEAG